MSGKTTTISLLNCGVGDLECRRESVERGDGLVVIVLGETWAGERDRFSVEDSWPMPLIPVPMRCIPILRIASYA